VEGKVGVCSVALAVLSKWGANLCFLLRHQQVIALERILEEGVLQAANQAFQLVFHFSPDSDLCFSCLRNAHGITDCTYSRAPQMCREWTYSTLVEKQSVPRRQHAGEGVMGLAMDLCLSAHQTAHAKGKCNSAGRHTSMPGPLVVA
jgi:hypothetical protein